MRIDHDRIVRALLMTGCRHHEIGGLMWSEFGTERITTPKERMKGTAEHEVELPPDILVVQTRIRGR
jgi:integrase